MKVVVGGLIRDRLPQLRVYLGHLHGLVADGVEIRWTFVLDNCGPEAIELVHTIFPEAETPEICDRGRAYDRERRPMYRRMAELRNLLRRRALESQAEALFSIDSDIVVLPELLTMLLRAERPWIGAIVDNSRGTRRWFNVLVKRPSADEFRFLNVDLVQGGTADVVGAACFYRRDLLEAAAFAYDRQGEDVGFARQALAAGFSGAYLPVLLEHLMTDAQTQGHLQRCALCS